MTDDLRAEVEGLRRLMGDLLDRLVGQQEAADGPAGVRTPAWVVTAAAAPPEGADPEGDLEAWVSWAIGTYELERWPTCWREHRGVVLELAAFRQWWAQATQGSSGQQLAVWHEHWWRFIARVHQETTTLTRCQGGRSHRGASVTIPKESDQPTRSAPVEACGGMS